MIAWSHEERERLAVVAASMVNAFGWGADREFLREMDNLATAADQAAGELKCLRLALEPIREIRRGGRRKAWESPWPSTGRRRRP